MANKLWNDTMADYDCLHPTTSWNDMVTCIKRKEADYIIYKEGEITYALNGNTGNIDSSNVDSAIVIQYAFNNKPTGETSNVLIKKANTIYAISNKITIPDDLCVTIQGNLKLNDGVNDNMFENEDYASNVANDNIIFIGDGGYIDMNRTNNTGVSGIFGAFTNSRFEGLRIENCSHHGICITGHSQKVIITKCVFKTIDYGGVQCHWDEDDNTRWDDITITDNILDNCAKHAYPSGAIWLSGGDNVICTNNHLINVDNGIGIMIFNGDAAIGLQNALIKGNIINGGKEGIRVCTSAIAGSYSRGIIISENIIKDSNETGIYINSIGDVIENLIISHNQIYNPTFDGIKLETTEDGVGIIHTLIDGNIIVSPGINYSGILLVNGNINTTTISNNFIRNVTGTGNGIAAFAQYTVINSNHIDINGVSGIEITHLSTIVSNNMIKNNGEQCIFVNTANYALVTSNLCKGTCIGLKTQGSITGLRAMENSFTYCTGAAWLPGGAHINIRIRNNIGLVLNNFGKTSAKNGATIPHGCYYAPTSVIAVSSVQGHICTVSAKNADNFTINLVTDAGAVVNVNEDIYWTVLRN